MKKKKVTISDLLQLINGIGNIDSAKKDKLSWTIISFINELKEHIQTYNKEVLKIQQELCSVDSDGNFFIDEKNNPIFTKFTKANQIARELKEQSLLKKEIEIEVYDCSDYSRIKTLDLSLLNLFNGILFNVEKEQIEKWYFESENKEQI